jgi:hypothetical protein
MLDITDFITERGGDPKKIRESQRRRHAKEEVVDEVIEMYEDHRKSSNQPMDVMWDCMADKTLQPSTQPTKCVPRSTLCKKRSDKSRRSAVEKYENVIAGLRD